MVASALGLVFVVLSPVPAGAQLYRWTDAEGVVRYTNDLGSIPPAHRATAREVGSPQARPEPPGPTVESTTIPFTPGQPIWTAARLNGIPLTLMLDTGAARTLISPVVAARAGIDVGRGRRVGIQGVTGQAVAREVVVERLDLAGTRVGPLAVVVHDLKLPEGDGLLGRDVLDAFTLTVDAAAGRAVLTPR